MYKFKQDLAMAYFDGCSKKTASRLLAREINLTPGLLEALRPTGYRPAQKRLSPPPTPNPLLLPRRTMTLKKGYVV
ncbi:MAG: DUF4248 domain-containing protein [Bacteroidales bacterium]|nr:DUF4248 domain-containing protein [Bacteroidales bacterium]